MISSTSSGGRGCSHDSALMARTEEERDFSSCPRLLREAAMRRRTSWRAPVFISPEGMLPLA